MTDHDKGFEQGVRFVMEHSEIYTQKSGPDITQFGRFQMTMPIKSLSEMLEGSRDHLERRIQAVLSLQETEKLL